MLAFQCRTKSLSLPFQVNLAGFLDSSGRAFFNYFNDFFEETLIYRLMIFFIFERQRSRPYSPNFIYAMDTQKSIFFYIK